MLKLVQDTSARGEEALATMTWTSCAAWRQADARLRLLASARPTWTPRRPSTAGKRLVVGKGTQGEGGTTGAGMVEVKAPGSTTVGKAGITVRSSCLPTWQIAQGHRGLPVLYLRGLSPGTSPGLAKFLGSEAGLSPSTVQRLTESWQDERERWAGRDCLAPTTCTGGQTGCTSTCASRRTGCAAWSSSASARRHQGVVALADGYRESKESWARCCAACASGACPAGARRGRRALASGPPSGTCSPPPKNSGVGCTRLRT